MTPRIARLRRRRSAYHRAWLRGDLDASPRYFLTEILLARIGARP